jgi:twitching motility two-component system response regulator PilG
MAPLSNPHFDATRPSSLEEAPLHTAAPAVPALRLLVKGFSPMEHCLLQGTVKLSQRRSPRLDLLDDAAAESADIVMVDARDPESMQWARRRQAWLARKAVIWVDTSAAPQGHTAARRPVQWPVLPMLLARALEHGPRQPNDPTHTVAAPAAAGAASTSNTTSMRPVLVVDDSLAVRAHLRSLLEARGISVTLADSAEAGIEAAAATHYGCILMDVLMPGIDGYEACRRIKASPNSGRQRPSIVMLTSKASPFDRIRGKMAGCDAYLTKPVDPTQLHEVLAQFIKVAPVVPAAAAARTPPRRLA